MSFQDYYFKKGYEMQKTAGVGSEVAGTLLNPLSTALATPAMLAGLVIGEDSKKNIGNSALANILIPGVGPYRLGKRMHASLLND